MQVAHNTYSISGAIATLRVFSNKTGTHEVAIDAEYVQQLTKFKWCFEISKQLVYTMDMSMAVAGDIFEYKTPRIYLWKYLVFLKTGCIHSEWARNNKLDYRLKSGVIRKHPICS